MHEISDSSFIDKKSICSSAYAEESKRNGCADFEITNYNLMDSRDVDFNSAENRLYYVLVYGYSIISVVEKGVLTFLNHLSGIEKQLLIRTNKICSLSNGPGFDIIGYLNAFPKKSFTLANSPSFMCINIFQSWEPLYQWMSSFVCQALELPLSKNASFLCKDLFEENQINELSLGCYNVLLMVNVFLSSKGTAQVVSSTMLKIFAQLKGGSLIFFFGSEKCMAKVVKLISKFNSVSVKFGPVNVQIEENEMKPKQWLKKICFAVFEKKTDLEMLDFGSKTQPSMKQVQTSVPNPICNLNDVKSSLLSDCSVSDNSLYSNFSSSISSLSTSVASSSKHIFSKKDSNFSADDKDTILCNQEDAGKRGFLMDSRQNAHFTDLKSTAVNTDNLDSDKKANFEKLIQDSICKALENIFHASELKNCSGSKLIDSASDTKSKVSKFTQVDLHESDKHNGNEDVSKSFNPASENKNKNSMNSRLVSGAFENLPEKALKHSLSPDFPSFNKHENKNVKSPDLISMIENCQKLIDAGKKMIESICTLPEASFRNNHEMHSCCVRGVQDFISYNCCNHSNQPCWHHGQACCAKTLPCCCSHDNLYFNQCTPSHVMYSGCRISPYFAAARPSCKASNTELNNATYSCQCNTNSKSAYRDRD